MLSHSEMVSLQAEHHGLVTIDHFRSEKEYVLYLIHQVAYESAAVMAQNRKVLDLGCNNGYGCAILNCTSQSVTGVDVSPQAIAAAQEKYGEGDIRFEVIDGNASSLEGETFEVITSFQVIEHIVDVSSYLANLHKLLGAAGIGVLTTPNASLRLYPGMRPWNRFHVLEYTAEELKALLEKTFDHVQVFGLFADEPVYSIEKSRVEGSRERARVRQENERKRLYRGLANLKSWKRSLKNALGLDRLQAERKARRKSMKTVDQAFIEQNSTSNFYYASRDLDKALDLLAICSDSKEELLRASRLLQRREDDPGESGDQQKANSASDL